MLHRTTTIKILLYFFFTIVGGIVSAASPADAAILYVNPAEQTVALRESFVVDILLNSEGETINTVQTSINYSPDLLEILDVSKGGSFLTLWPEEPLVSAPTGVVSLVGGIPNGSLVVDGRVVRLFFRAKALGTSSIRFDEDNSAIYLNDGKGTKTALSSRQASYKVTNPSPFLVEITSSTHPDENIWYNKVSATLTWQVKEGALYSYALAESPLDTPDEKIEDQVGKVTFDDLEDGIHYFILREKLDGDEWGPVSMRRIMVDRSPPIQFEYAFSKDDAGKSILIFSANDKFSGIDRYQITEGRKGLATAQSPYTLLDQSRKSAITLQAVDSAGNISEISIPGLGRSETKKGVDPLVWVAVSLVAIVSFVSLFLVSKRRKIT